MEFNLKEWLENYKRVMLELFGDRVLMLGIQGSYSRGEQKEKSMLDAIAVLDEVSSDDVLAYGGELADMVEHDFVRGLIIGHDTLMAWEKSELFQFINDTKIIEGNFEFIAGVIKMDDVKRSVLMDACKIYRMCCRNLIKGKSLDNLKTIAKSCKFLLQTKYYYENNKYIKRKEDLFKQLSEDDRNIFIIARQIDDIENIGEPIIEDWSAQILDWIQKVIKEFSF